MIMPNTCSVPGCMSSYNPVDADILPVFKMPQKQDEQRHTWLLALHRDDIYKDKAMYVCSKHFREDEATKPYNSTELRLKLLQRDTCSRPKLKDGAVQSTLLSSILFNSITSHQTQPSLSSVQGW